jgi:hypothetical protein
MTRTNRVEGWGVTGWSNEFGALTDDSSDEPSGVSGYGFERVLDPGTIYFPQPVVDGVPAWFKKPGSKARVFQMAWESPEAPVTQSLLDLHNEIKSRRRDLTPDDQAIARLDAAIGSLIATASRLHGNGESLGFLQPDSVRIGTRHDGSTYVVLPDVGFAWDDTGGLYEPDWLANPQTELVFERGARDRNVGYATRLKTSTEKRDLRTQAKERAAEEREDVKIVTRLIALALAGSEEVKRWCGPAKSLLRLPGKDVAPDTAAPIWDQVIAPSLDGKIATFEELGLRLAAAKPSEHFFYQPPSPPWRGWMVVRRVAVAAAAVAGLFGLWQMKDVLFPPRAYAPFCASVPERDPLFGKLAELQRLHDRARVDKDSRPGFWTLLQECTRAHAALPQCKKDCLRSLADDYLEMMVADGDDVLARLRAAPRPVAAERPEIRESLAAIRDAASEANRPFESSVVKRLERQLELRDGGSSSRPFRPDAEVTP